MFVKKSTRRTSKDKQKQKTIDSHLRALVRTHAHTRTHSHTFTHTRTHTLTLTHKRTCFTTPNSVLTRDSSVASRSAADR